MEALERSPGRFRTEERMLGVLSVITEVGGVPGGGWGVMGLLGSVGTVGLMGEMGTVGLMGAMDTLELMGAIGPVGMWVGGSGGP